MTALLTDPVGAAHIAQLVAGTATTHAFDALELGDGLDVPTVTDTRAAMDPKIGGTLVQVATGYPVLGDSDIRNDGRGEDVYSWKFVYPEGVAIHASNAIVTNYDDGAPSGGEQVMVHAAEPLVKRVDQELSVWINVSTALAATIVAHVDDATLLPEQVMGWADRGAIAAGGPGSHQRSGVDVFSPAREGQPIPTLWFLRNADGEPIRRSDLAAAQCAVLVGEGDNQWTHLYDLALDVWAVAFDSPQRQSHLWRAGGGYYGAWTFVPYGDHGAKRTRLEITLTLLDSTTRTIVHEIDYQAVR